MTSPPPAPREVWWVWIVGSVESKERICVVTLVEADYMRVVYGQGKARAGVDHVFVAPDAPGKPSPNGRALHVSKDTYFRDTNFRNVKVTFARRKVGLCPAQLFTEFLLREERALQKGWVDRMSMYLTSLTATEPPALAAMKPKKDT